VQEKGQPCRLTNLLSRCVQCGSFAVAVHFISAMSCRRSEFGKYLWQLGKFNGRISEGNTGELKGQFMKVLRFFRRADRRHQYSVTRFIFRFAALLACGCVGFGLFFPAIKHATAGNHRVPRGQLKADLCTLMAGVHYFFETGDDIRTNPCRPGTNDLVELTNNRWIEMSVGISNQSRRVLSSSNSPA